MNDNFKNELNQPFLNGGKKNNKMGRSRTMNEWNEKNLYLNKLTADSFI